MIMWQADNKGHKSDQGNQSTEPNNQRHDMTKTKKKVMHWTKKQQNGIT